MSDYLFCDNTLVSSTKWGVWFLSIYVTETGASLTRYCVPGRIDAYSFDWVPGDHQGTGDKVTFFTDTGISLNQAVARLNKDLKKKEVKTLLKAAKAKLGPRSYLTPLLEALR